MAANKFALLFILILYGGVGLAQQPDVESFLERQDEYSDISDLLEMLADLEKKPIDLNLATIEQLAALPWISDMLARTIIQFRQQTGGFQSVQQLSQIDGIDDELILILKNYITIFPPKIPHLLSISAKTRIGQKLKQPEGIKKGIYAPSPSHIYNRYIIQYGNNFSFGILLEKDSGEKRWDDLRCYFFKYQDRSNQKKVIVGNYRLEFGLGLIFGNPYYYSKGGSPVYSLKRHTKEVIEYKIVDENASLYGIAGQLSFKSYQIFLFYSENLRNASLNLDGTIKNFHSSGYHRSASEIKKKNNLTEQLIGARINLKPTSNYSLGMTYYHNRFSRRFAPVSETQNLYPANQNLNALVGTDFNAIFGRLNFLGEAAISRSRGYGLVSGVIMDANPIKLACLARNYTRDFFSFHGNSFSEMSSYPRNEQGIYLGLQYSILKKLKLNLYFDQFKFPWSTYLISMPSKGSELFFRLEHKPRARLAIYFQIKTSQKDQAITTIDASNRTRKVILPRRQTSARFQFDYQPVKNMSIRHRIEKNWGSYENYLGLPLTKKNEFQGISLYQDISFRLGDNLICTGRITFFETDSYESRIYQFERDVPGMFTNQMLYDAGNRWYVTLDWKLTSFLRMSCKFGSIHYYNFNSIGSGLDMVQGNTLNSLKLQIELNH